MKEKIIRRLKDSFVGLLTLCSIVVAFEFIYRFNVSSWKETTIQILVIIISISNIVFIIKKYGEK